MNVLAALCWLENNVARHFQNLSWDSRQTNYSDWRLNFPEFIPAAAKAARSLVPLAVRTRGEVNLLR